jgi:hypothetical protein
MGPIVPNRKFWLPLAAAQFVEKEILEKRQRAVRSAIPSVNMTRDYGQIPFSRDEVFFEDLMYFAVKGIKMKYLIQIFTDLKYSNSISQPAISDKTIKAGKEYGTNQYSLAAQVRLYDHVISCAKEVYGLRGYTDSQKNDGALLVLMHDMGKVSNYLRQQGYHVSGTHSEISGEYAKQIVSDEEDKVLKEMCFEYLAKPVALRNYSEDMNYPGRICTAVDVANRNRTAEAIIRKRREA